jgi:dihydrofolate reductase
MTVWHCHLAMSLDGRIARADGSFDWLAPYPPDEYGIDAFHASVDITVMGRATYEIERAQEPWPHAGRPVLVVTSQPLADAPPQVEAWPHGVAALVREVERRGHRKVAVEGGGQLVRGLVEIGRLDVLELALIPLVLGDGIPLFPSGTRELPLRLRRCETKSGGALHLIYERAGIL